MLLVYSRIELLDQQKAKCFIQAWYLYLWGELLRSTLKHFAHTFLSFASVVTHFPSCALDFSHFSFEISTWGLATWWSALSFPAHHQVGFSSETFDIFLSLGLLPHLLASGFISFPVFYSCNLWAFPFNSSLSSGKHSILSVPWFLILTLLLPSCDYCSLNHSTPEHGPLFFSLPVSHLLCPDIVSDIVFDSVEFFSLFYFLVADSSLSL